MRNNWNNTLGAILIIFSLFLFFISGPGNFTIIMTNLGIIARLFPFILLFAALFIFFQKETSTTDILALFSAFLVIYVYFHQNTVQVISELQRLSSVTLLNCVTAHEYSSRLNQNNVLGGSEYLHSYYVDNSNSIIEQLGFEGLETALRATQKMAVVNNDLRLLGGLDSTKYNYENRLIQLNSMIRNNSLEIQDLICVKLTEKLETRQKEIYKSSFKRTLAALIKSFEL